MIMCCSSLFQKLLEAPRTTHLGERVEVEREELLLEGHARLALGEHVARDAEHREAAVGHLGVQLLQLVLALPIKQELSSLPIIVYLRDHA